MAQTALSFLNPIFFRNRMPRAVQGKHRLDPPDHLCDYSTSSNSAFLIPLGPCFRGTVISARQLRLVWHNASLSGESQLAVLRSIVPLFLLPTLGPPLKQVPAPHMPVPHSAHAINAARQ